MAENQTTGVVTAEQFAALLKQFNELQTKMTQQGGVPLDSTVVPLESDIDPKGMHKLLVSQLKHTHFKPGVEKDGLKISAMVRVGQNPAQAQTAVLKGGKWVLHEKSPTLAQLAGEATKADAAEEE